MISGVVENSWNWNFADFRDLVLILPEATTGSVLYSQENTCARVSFKEATLLKKRLWHRGLPVNLTKFLRNLFYSTALDDFFYFTIPESEELLSEKKFIHISIVIRKSYDYDISQGVYRFRFLLQRFFSFSSTNACLPCRLRKRILHCDQPPVFGKETPKYNVLAQFWKPKFFSEHFSRNSRFLSFEGSSNYLYLFKNHRQRFSWLGERPSSFLKFSKIWFGPNIKYLSQPLFVDFFVIEKNIYYVVVIHTYIIRFCYARQHVGRTVWVE